MKKKLLSAILALAMVLSLLPMAAFADTVPDVGGENTDTTTDKDIYSIYFLSESYSAERNDSIKVYATNDAENNLFDSATMKASVKAGTEVTVEISAGDGRVVDSVDIQGVDATKAEDTYTYTFTMPNDPNAKVTVSVEFIEEGAHRIRTSATHGTVNIDETTAKEGAEVSFTVTANSGYEVDSVKVTYTNENEEVVDVECKLVEGTYSFTMPAAEVTITLVCVGHSHTIATATGTTGVTLGQTTAKTDDTVTFTVTVPNDSIVSSVKVTYTNEDEEVVDVTWDLDEDGTYSFTMPDADVTVEVAFSTVEVKTDETQVDIAQDADIEDEYKTTVSDALSAKDVVTEAAVKALANTAVENPAVIEALSAAENVPEEIVVTVYMQVTAKAYTPGEEASLTVDITPMFKVTSSDDTEVVPATAMPVSTAVDVTVGLPSGFVSVNAEGQYPSVYVLHTHNSRDHLYIATVANEDGTLVASFHNPNGFSEFVISVTNPAKAKINETYYADLAEAVDAVQNGQTIKLLANDDGTGDIVVSHAVTFTIDSGAYTYDPSRIKPGEGYKLTLDGNTFTITAEGGSGNTGSSGGGGGGGSASVTRPVTVSSGITGGTVTVTPANAPKGTSVTVSVKPNSGYRLDTLTVKDANGNEIALTKVSDTQYTFTMPDAQVTVNATFVTDDAPMFTDLEAGAYYYDAVLWAVEKGITTGTSATTFSPDATCTRAEMVTFLWRAAGSPAPQSTNNPFTDVQSGTYYYDAVLWAVENEITTGTTETTFSPNMTVTRCQTVTFLYRAAGSPAVQSPVVTGTSAFTDVATGSYYSNAVQWAVENDITNGTGPNTFSPEANCTRGQIVTFLYRAQ